MKKLLSIILALIMISASISGFVYAADGNVTITAADVIVNANNNGIGESTVISFGNNIASTQYGTAKIYKEDGVFGLAEGEYGIELIAREQRKDEPYIAFNVGDIDASKDFYVSTNVYIGQQRDSDLIRLGTTLMKEDGNELKLDAGNFQGYKFFTGDGKIKYRRDGADTKYQNGAYESNNWINYTIAGTNGVIAIYVDGVKFEGGWVNGISGGNKTIAYNGILKSVNPGIRFLTQSSELGGIPSFALFKDVKLVYGTYNPADTNTAVSSSVYNVTYMPITVGSGSTASKSVITGVSASETVSEFLSGITAPAGGSVSVIKIADDSKKTIPVSGSEYMAGDMKLLVKSADGSMKIYSIDVSLTDVLTVDATDYTQSGYALDENTKTITLMPHTTVETVRDIFIANSGVTYKVVSSKGKEVVSGAITDTMKLVATKGVSSVEYGFKFADTTAIDVSSRIKGIEDGTKIFEADGLTTSYDYSGKGLYGINHSSAGYNQLEKANPKVAPTGSYVVTKTNMPGHTEENRVNAWYFDAAEDNTAWRKHSSNALGLYNATRTDKGKKTIISFSVNLNANSGFSFAPRHAFTNGTKVDCTDIQYLNTSNTGTGDRITFTNDGKVQLGGQNRDWSLAGYGSNYLQQISSYQAGTEYEVVLVESRGTTVVEGVEYATVVTEAVYINGVNVIEGDPKTMVIKDGRDYYGIRDITFQTIGDCYVGGLKIYMADEYSIAVAEDDEEEEPGTGETPEDADLTITALNDTLEIYTNDPLANNMATVKGYTGNVGELRNAIDSDINTRLEVLDKTATASLTDNIALQVGMYVKVSDVNNPDRYVLYLLSDILNMGEFTATQSGNIITVNRTIKSYKTENKPVTVIVSSVNSAGVLVDVDMDIKTVSEKGTYNFEVSVEKSDVVKVMMWNNSMVPYGNAISAFDLLK